MNNNVAHTNNLISQSQLENELNKNRDPSICVKEVLKKSDALRLIQGGAGHENLAEAEPAVAGRYFGMAENSEALAFQPGSKAFQQVDEASQVVEDAGRLFAGNEKSLNFAPSVEPFFAIFETFNPSKYKSD